MSRFAHSPVATASHAAGQTTLELGADDHLLQGAPLPAATCEEHGFAIGWDHAHHGLVPPAELLLDGSPVSQGWRAGKAVFGARTLAASRPVRQWLALRLVAWRTGAAFEEAAVTPNHLKQIDNTHCPITRSALGGTAGAATASLIERVNQQASYAAGNLVVLSHAAAQARQGLSAEQTVKRAQLAERTQALGLPADNSGLNAAAWWRLATLAAFATPMAYAQAARLPLAMLPPNRARVLNVAQCLQALLTLQFTLPHWSERMTAFASWLPADQGLRTDFHLFVGALAPRAIEAQFEDQPHAKPHAQRQAQPPAQTASAHLRRALEDAWLQPRVQRRWLQFALALGEARASILAERLANLPLPGKAARWHGIQQALDGWSLPATATGATTAAADANAGANTSATATATATATAASASASAPSAQAQLATPSLNLDLEIALPHQGKGRSVANAQGHRAAPQIPPQPHSRRARPATL
jgi:hypothetical protein